MGSGIAYVAAKGGYRVDVVEPDQAARRRGAERIAADARRGNDSGAVERIAWLDAIPARSDAFCAIEAVSERFDVKRDVFVALAAALGAGALLATNTSSLSVEALADAVAGPERVLGLHFFNPPAAMKLVEVVAAPQTAQATVDAAYAFVERIGKTAVLAADTPGFIVNRVARPFYLQALHALERGVATPLELDALARGAGFRMGPFELMDLIGLDVNLATTESVYDRTGAQRLAPVATQRRMVEQGRLGRKTGSGFYDYTGGPPERLAFPDEAPSTEPETDEFVAIVGFGGLADELNELADRRVSAVQRIESDELLDELSPAATIVFDVGDGTTDRSTAVAELDSLLGPEAIFFVDAYATDVGACAAGMKHPERLVGYGILGSLAAQRAVEIVDSARVSDDALVLAQEFFESLGKGVVLVENVTGLFLGRTIGSIVNEAVTAVHEEVATPDDVDTAMRLGTNYPIGPVAWGREIGGARVARILQRLANDENAAFAPHRSLWVLDVEEEPEPLP